MTNRTGMNYTGLLLEIFISDGLPEIPLRFEFIKKVIQLTQ
jgi:hypothetical protein